MKSQPLYIKLGALALFCLLLGGQAWAQRCGQDRCRRSGVCNANFHTAVQRPLYNRNGVPIRWVNVPVANQQCGPRRFRGNRFRNNRFRGNRFIGQRNIQPYYYPSYLDVHQPGYNRWHRRNFRTRNNRRWNGNRRCR